MDDFRERKAERTAYYMRYVHGKKLVKCVACNGSGPTGEYSSDDEDYYPVGDEW